MEYTNTKKMANAYQEYLRIFETSPIGARTIWNCYERPSNYKERAYNSCLDLSYDLNGHGETVMGFNSMTFSFGFVFTNEEGQECFGYITRDYNRYAVIEELEKKLA